MMSCQLILIANLIGFKFTMETHFGVYLRVCYQESLTEEKDLSSHKCTQNYLIGWGPGLKR